MMITGIRQGPEAVNDGFQYLPAGLARRLRDPLVADDPPPGDAEAEPDQEAGHDPRQEQLGYRDIADDAEENEADARGNDRGDDAAGRNEAGRMPLAVTGRDHHRHHQCRQRGGIGGGRPGKRRQDAGGEDGDIAEPAAQMADQRHGDVDNARCQSAPVHEFAGEHEERHGHQRETVRAVDDVLRDDLGIEYVEGHHQRDPADEQRIGDGHADRHGAEKREGEDGDGHDRHIPKGSPKLTSLRTP
jgi:hypothetical protein